MCAKASHDRTMRLWDLRTPHPVGGMHLPTPTTRPLVTYDPEGLIFAGIPFSRVLHNGSLLLLSYCLYCYFHRFLFIEISQWKLAIEFIMNSFHNSLNNRNCQTEKVWRLFIIFLEREKFRRVLLIVSSLITCNHVINSIFLSICRNHYSVIHIWSNFIFPYCLSCVTVWQWLCESCE